MKKSNTIRIKFLGDLAFSDAFQKSIEDGTDPFQDVKQTLRDADAVVGNLEVVAFGSAQNMSKTPRIGTSIEAINELKNLNLDLVTLATNHFYDNLREGFEKTVSKLNELGISHIGASTDKIASKVPFVLEKKGWRIGFLNYVHKDTHPSLPSDADVFPNRFWMHQIIEDILRLKEEADRVVVLLHWGGKTDYGYFPHQEQLPQAREMVKAGADAIIGCHTHTFQAREVINGKPVYYSLGNFCFADIHCDGGVYTVRESGKKGGIVNLIFKEDGTVGHEVEPIINIGNRIVHAPELNKEFTRWNFLFRLTRGFPGAYSFYYWALKRIEPVFYHAQLNDTTVKMVAWNKFLKLLRIR